MTAQGAGPAAPSFAALPADRAAIAVPLLTLTKTGDHVVYCAEM